MEVRPGTGPEHGSAGAQDLMDFSVHMTALTWVVFAAMAYILYKVAWKPILRGLETRERSIRKALDDAEKARAALAEIEARGRQATAQAETQAKRILDEAKTSAVDLAEKAQKQARDEARSIRDEAERDIESAADRARATLRAESAELAVLMAERVVGETLDPARQKQLVDRLVKEI
jgi:F-type H+-transporting ATPase subunit b